MNSESKMSCSTTADASTTSEGNIYEQLNIETDTQEFFADEEIIGTTRKRGGRRVCLGKMHLVLFVGLIALLLVTVSACVALGVQISTLKSEIATLQSTSSSQQSSIQKLNASRDQVQNTVQELKTSIGVVNSSISSTAQQLIGSIGMVNSSLNSMLQGKFQQLNTSIGMVNSSLRSGNYENFPAPSCAALPPSSPSGYYWVSAANGSAVRVYCDMNRSCGNVTGWWMRVAKVDMKISGSTCPTGLRLRTDSNRHTCGVNSNYAACSSATLSSSGLEYSRVCGKIRAYQVGSTDTFGNSGRGTNPTINTYYVDGISLTHGIPRQHIWTFAAGLDEVGTTPQYNCPCTNINFENRATRPPSYVGNDYFCDTASNVRYQNGLFYHDDPLWDELVAAL